MKNTPKCEKCKKEMKFLGNISGMVYTSYPVQWDDVYICEGCKEKKTIRESGQLPPDYSFIADYPEQIKLELNKHNDNTKRKT